VLGYESFQDLFFIFLSTYNDGGFFRHDGAVLHGGGDWDYYFKIQFKHGVKLFPANFGDYFPQIFADFHAGLSALFCE
jgi:hypothetical protein